MTKNICIVGSGHNKFGRSDKSLERLIVEVTGEAAEKAGIATGDIDAVLLGPFQFRSGRGWLCFVADPSCLPGTALNPGDAGRERMRLRFGSDPCRYQHAEGRQDLNRIGRWPREMTYRTTEDVTTALAGAGYRNHAVGEQLAQGASADLSMACT